MDFWWALNPITGVLMRERRGRFDPNQEEGLVGVGVRGEKEEEDLNMSWCDRPKG